MKVLVIHHVEPMWEGSFRVTPQLYVESILQHLEGTHYDKIIMTTLEGDTYPELENECNQHEWWSYGWEDPEDPDARRWYEENGIDPETDIIPASGHDFTFIYPWIKELKDIKVDVLGGSSSSCLADLIDALNYIGVDFTILWELTY